MRSPRKRNGSGLFLVSFSPASASVFTQQPDIYSWQKERPGYPRNEQVGVVKKHFVRGNDDIELSIVVDFGTAICPWALTHGRACIAKHTHILSCPTHEAYLIFLYLQRGLYLLHPYTTLNSVAIYLSLACVSSSGPPARSTPCPHMLAQERAFFFFSSMFSCDGPVRSSYSEESSLVFAFSCLLASLAFFSFPQMPTWSLEKSLVLYGDSCSVMKRLQQPCIVLDIEKSVWLECIIVVISLDVIRSLLSSCQCSAFKRKKGLLTNPSTQTAVRSTRLWMENGVDECTAVT